ncbi:unnamed protein product [Heterosigma akashiwo]
MVDYEPLCWSLAAIMLSCVAVFGLTLSHKWSAENRTTEEFLTARGKVTSMWRLAWSFYAGAVGAWVVASPSSYASFAGMIGLIFYALACGMPFLVIAFAGPVIQRRLPNVTSLAEYMGHRFGAYSQIYVALIILLNMAVATIVEYITIGTLFEVYLGSTGWPMVVVIGMLTLFYTTWGGLLVSIATDQVQGICSFFLVVFVFFYLVATFQEDLPRPMPSYIAGTTEYGYSAIFTMPLSLFVGTTFSEAMWQRAWAAASPRKLQVAAALGGAGVVLVVLVSGLCGWLAAWAGLLDSYPNPNLYMFYGLRGTVDEATGNIANWFGVLALLLAAMMCCGAVDSFQNGFLAAFNGLTSVAIRVLDAKRPGTFPPGYQVPLKWTRLAVVALNVPLIALGAAGSKEEWAVLDFFLITNMLGTTAAGENVPGHFQERSGTARLRGPLLAAAPLLRRHQLPPLLVPLVLPHLAVRRGRVLGRRPRLRLRSICVHLHPGRRLGGRVLPKWHGVCVVPQRVPVEVLRRRPGHQPGGGRPLHRHQLPRDRRAGP